MNWFERLNREAAGRIAVRDGLTVEVVNWAYVPHLPDNILHRHTYFEVCLVGGWGSGQFRVGQGAAQTQHRIGPGNLFIARPGVLHQIVNEVGAPVNMELMWFSFHVPIAAKAKSGPSACEPIAALFEDFSRAADLVVVSDSDALAVTAIWNALRVTASTGEPAGQNVQMTALTTALLLAIAQAGGVKNADLPLPPAPSVLAKRDDRLARQAVQYIHQHLSRPLPVGEIAEFFAVSPRHLNRLLRAYTGVSPQEYVEQARLDRARTLLLRTDDPIKQVALLAGYADVAHFTRAFGRRFGCPPGVFRRTGGKADQTVRGDAMKTPGALV